MRASSGLDKAICDIAQAAGIKKHLSAKFMRRTFQDLGRAAEVNDLVVRSISGHATAQMQERYSSVGGEEVRAGLAKVISLAGFKAALDGGDQGKNESGDPSGDPDPKSETAGGPLGPNRPSLLERDKRFELSTFSLGKGASPKG